MTTNKLTVIVDDDGKEICTVTHATAADLFNISLADIATVRSEMEAHQDYLRRLSRLLQTSTPVVLDLIQDQHDYEDPNKDPSN